MTDRRQFNKSVLLSALAAAIPSMLSASLAQAQSAWPNKPIKWIVSQPAGAGPDILARFIAESVSKRLGQQIVVENRAGGQNVIGSMAAKSAAPDGYTFYYATTAAMVTNSFTFKTLPYDPEKDFEPVRLIGKSPFVLAAGPGLQGTSLADAIAAAKAQSGQISIGTEGPKTFSGMLADSFAHMAGVKLNHVPYTKATDAIQDLIGGRIALLCLPEAAVLTMIRAGQIKPLAVSSAQRTASQPSVPTLGETFSGFEYTGWNGVFAPAGTPAAIVERMNQELDAVMKQPEIVQRLVTMGSIATTSMSVAAFQGFMRDERKRWAEIVRAIGIKPE